MQELDVIGEFQGLGSSSPAPVRQGSSLRWTGVTSSTGLLSIHVCVLYSDSLAQLASHYCAVCMLSLFCPSAVTPRRAATAVQTLSKSLLTIVAGIHSGIASVCLLLCNYT